MKFVATSLAALALLAAPTLAQTPQTFAPGTVLRAGDLNAAFGAVLPKSGGTLTGPLTVPGLSDTGTLGVTGAATMGSITASGGAISGADVSATVGSAAGSLARTLAPVNQRAPGATDDTTAGYSVGDFWTARGITYRCIQNAAGGAVWQVYAGATALPLDAVGGTAPLAAYGTRKLRAAYTGKALNVVRASDSTALDIGFLPDGSLDTASLDAFLAGTTGRVAIWYDQSGNGNNATAATANQPAVTSQNVVGNARSLVFDAVQHGTTTQRYMVIPTGVAVTTQAFSAFTLGSYANSAIDVDMMQLTGVSSAPSFWFGTNNTAGGLWSAITGAGFAVAPVKGSLSAAFGGVIAGPSSWTSYFDNVASAQSGTGNTSLAGGYLGAAPVDGANATGYVDLVAAFVWGRTLSATDETNLQASLATAFGLVPQARDTIAFAGDSITDGYGGSNLLSYPRKAFGLLGMPARFYDVGAFGASIAGLSASGSYNLYTKNTLNSAARNNVLMIFAGTNDYSAGTSGATVYADIQAYAAQGRAEGRKVIIATSLPRSDVTGANETQRLAGNALLRANWSSFADALADFASDPTMGLNANTSNTTYYYDGIHPTDLGYTYLAPIAARAVQSVLR